jgi:Zn-dependent M28 family amino/carboxypeptidase
MNARSAAAAALGLALALAMPLAAQQPAGRVTTAEIDGHLRYLSSDLLEGRAPATRGGALTSAYIEAQLRAFGLQPGMNGSYIQTVPIDVVGTEAGSMRVAASGKANRTLRYPEDVVVWAGSANGPVGASAEVVFAGYGATAPEFRWDDFKDVDVRGKILLVLVNDPPAPAGEPNHFGGRAMTWYGRWPYKFEEAERRGAAGLLLVHTTEEAGYPWHTVVGSWAKEQRMLPRPANAPAPLGFRAWIQDTVAASMLRQAGLDLAALRRRAARRDFRPVPTGITVSVDFRRTAASLQSDNVVGVLPGADPALKDEHVVFSAHWDHLGIGPAVNGDSIYNGALDNASGVADLLGAARAAAEMPRPKRSLLFVFVTAEESGLLGSEFFAQNPPVPVRNLIANLNVDGGNLLGKATSFRVLGDTKSTLGPRLAAMLGRSGWTTVPDPHPERGGFYRSDHFSFARFGVPSVSIAAGTDYEGRDAQWGLQQAEDYTAYRYHQPSDAYRPDFDLSGAAQLAQVILDFGMELASSPELPRFNPDAEFRSAREQR